MDPPTFDDKAEIIVQPSLAAKQMTLSFVAVLAASAFAFLFGLGGLGFLGPDEPRYAEVAREMFATGDYISTRLCGCLWFEKPALLYWMSAAGYHLFGVSEFSARLPSALSATLTVALLYFVVRRSGFSRLAVTATLVLGTSGLFIAYARVVAQDMILTASMTAALLAAYRWTRTSGRARTTCWLAIFLFAGLAVLAKGLVGIVLVLAISGAYFFLAGRLGSIRWREALIGCVVFLAVAGTWYGPVILRHGWPFIEEFFVRHHFERYATNEFGHPQPVYFFLLVAIAGAAPWSPFLIPAVGRLRLLKPSSSSRDLLLGLAWIWTALPLLFFSFSESKLPGYILPISPALAIIIGAELERVWNADRARTLRIAMWMTALVVIAIGVAFIVFIDRESVSLSEWGTLLCGLPLALGVLSAGSLAVGKGRGFIASSAGVVLSVILGAVILLFPTLRDEVSLKPLSLQAAAALRPGEKIGFYLKKEFAPVFYSEGRVLCEHRRGTTFYALHQDMLADALESEPTLIIITDSHWVAGLQGDQRFTTEHIAAQGDALALRVGLRK
ncbi:MAG TPA: glycosyltransferase family 39 protein [Blastocatellia bacterium]|nr:glycosyltransferase family 39 protein [Blastocatellia bacterium]